MKPLELPEGDRNSRGSAPARRRARPGTRVVIERLPIVQVCNMVGLAYYEDPERNPDAYAIF